MSTVSIDRRGPTFLTLLLLAALAGCASKGEPKPVMASASPGNDPAAAEVPAPVTAPGAEGVAALPTALGVRPAVEISPANQRMWDRALEAIRVEDWRRAEILLLEITMDQPELSGPWVNLAQVYSTLERDDEARSAYLEAINADPGNCAARNMLGVLSRKDGDFQSAESHYQACLAQSPGFVEAQLNLGILYELYLGKLEDALLAYRRYQQITGGTDQRVAGWVMDLERRLGV